MKNVKAADLNNSSIIGVFEGECADSNITNKNGLDITREVWENTFASDEYAEGIKNGFFIGFLGHPQDVDCQQFKDACIVMTEGHIDQNGKVYGKFNLIDTPVGQIVKKFIDAGVRFGISVRGAGDIYNNSVDPETFVFRGFDLVAFPAFPESIPEFTAIAASTDLEAQKKYKAVCAAVRTNLQSITSAEALDVIQAQFAKQSEEYKMINDRKAEITGAEEAEDVEDEDIDLDEQRIESVTQLYLDTRRELLDTRDRFKKLQSSASASINRLKSVNASLHTKVDELNNHIQIIESSSTRKLKSMERITASQMDCLNDQLHQAERRYQTIKASNGKLKTNSTRITSDVEQLRAENQKLITANTQLQTENSKLTHSNLIYKKRIEATANDIKSKDSIISDLRTELRETVTANTEVEGRTSDLDAQVRSLKQEVSAATKLIQEYQDAYANLYANAIGVRLEDVRVTSATSVHDLQAIIGGTKVNSMQAIEAETDLSELADIDMIDNTDDNDLVTL